MRFFVKARASIGRFREEFSPHRARQSPRGPGAPLKRTGCPSRRHKKGPMALTPTLGGSDIGQLLAKPRPTSTEKSFGPQILAVVQQALFAIRVRFGSVVESFGVHRVQLAIIGVFGFGL